MNIIKKCRTQRKTAVITGATSGIGYEIMKLLIRDGYHCIAAGRNEEKLLEIVNESEKNRVTAVSLNLSNKKECYRLFELSLGYNTEVMINSAGIGVYGEFAETSFKPDMEMLDVNVRAVHILMKLFLRKFMCNNHGYILNVASSAGFLPGPMMSGYYAGKSYVINLSAAVREEVIRKKRNVKISVLCPGPVDTSFNERAGIKGKYKGISAEEAAKAAVYGMRSEKFMIIPESSIRFIYMLSGIFPKEFEAFVNYFVQKKKKRIRK